MSNPSNSLDWLPVQKDFATLCVHAGYEGENKNLSSIVNPISVSANYAIDVPAEHRGYDYARTNNLTRKVLEEKLAALDGGKYGICFSSGSGAISAALSLLNVGDHLIYSNDTIGVIKKQVADFTKHRGIIAEAGDFTDDDFQSFRKMLKPETKMVFLETPANPTLRVYDLKKISQIAHDYNKEIIVCVDNTCLTSYYQKCLTLGCDLVHYSLSKHMNGHADLVMGALVTNNEMIKDRARFFQNVVGAIPSPFDCYLVTRGLKTLPVRMRAVMESGLKVAEFLRDHPKVEQVNHPGLTTDPGHALAKRQSSGHSGLLSFRIKGGADTAAEFCKALKLFQYGPSFGGCESMAVLPGCYSHKSLPVETKQKLGITEDLIRLAIGLESYQDLIDDLVQAFMQC